MLASPLALCVRDGESLSQTVERGKAVSAMQRECLRLEVQLRKEIQFNRKVEINASVRRCKAEIAKLK
jgi:hypothetical protein